MNSFYTIAHYLIVCCQTEMWQNICNKYLGIHLNLPQLRLAKDKMSNAFLADKQLVENCFNKKSALQLRQLHYSVLLWDEKKEHFPMCSLQSYKKSAAVQHYPSFTDAQLTWCAAVHTVPWFSCLCPATVAPVTDSVKMFFKFMPGSLFCASSAIGMTLLLLLEGF